jgi:hypothetical protein
MAMNMHQLRVTALLLGCAVAGLSDARDMEKAVERHYVTAPAAPMSQTPEAAAAKSTGCLSCHTQTDSPSMHVSSAVNLGCTDCHGGDNGIALPSGASTGSAAYRKAQDSAHVLPRYPAAWKYP